MTEATITVELRQHCRTKNSWAVASVLVKEDHPTVKTLAAGTMINAVGNQLALAAPGETLQLTGVLEEDKFGEQFRVFSQISMGVQSSDNAWLWLKRLDGIGPKLAKAIHEALGDDMLKVLQNPPEPGCEDPLTAAEGVGEERAQAIRDSWDEVSRAPTFEDQQYLDGLGFSRWQVAKVLRAARKKRMGAREFMETWPFELVKEKGLGFMKVDSMARKAGCSFDAPARIEAGIAYVLKEQIDRHGHTRIKLTWLVSASAEVLNVHDLASLQGVMVLARRGDVVIDRSCKPKCVTPAPLLRAAESVFGAVMNQRGLSEGLAHGPADEPDCSPPELQVGAEKAGGEDPGGKKKTPGASPSAVPNTEPVRTGAKGFVLERFEPLAGARVTHDDW